MKIPFSKKNKFSVSRRDTAGLVNSSSRDWRAVMVFCAVLLIGLGVLGFFAFIESREGGEITPASPSAIYKFLDIKSFKQVLENFSARALDLASGRANRIEIVDPSR